MSLQGRVPGKLSPEQAHQVAKWIGEFQPLPTIAQLIRQHFGIKVWRYYGHDFVQLKRWQPVIDRYRQEWITQIFDVPLANKKYRLAKLQQQLDRLEASATGTARSRELRLLRVLNQARLEMEEKSETYVFNQFNTQITNATDAELLQRREELLKRIQAFRLPIRRISHALGNGREDVAETGREAHEVSTEPFQRDGNPSGGGSRE